MPYTVFNKRKLCMPSSIIYTDHNTVRVMIYLIQLSRWHLMISHMFWYQLTRLIRAACHSIGKLKKSFTEFNYSIRVWVTTRSEWDQFPVMAFICSLTIKSGKWLIDKPAQRRCLIGRLISLRRQLLLWSFHFLGSLVLYTFADTLLLCQHPWAQPSSPVMTMSPIV